MHMLWIVASALGMNAALAAPPSSQDSLPANHGQMEDPADQALRDREKLQKAYEGLNQYNPMSPDFKGGAQPAQGETAPTGPIAEFQKIMSYPAVQTLLQASQRLIRSPEVGNALDELIKSPNRMQLLYGQLGWLAIVFLFRAWKLSKLSVKHWTRIALLNILSFIVYWSMTLLFIPWMALGTAYPRLVLGVWRAIRGP